jgi:hypothetical protein
MVVAGNMKIATGGVMKSTGAVNVKATTQGIIVNEGTLTMDSIVFYSDNANDGLLLNKGTVNAPTDPNKVLLRKKFENGKWYAISFPFEVEISKIKDVKGTTTVSYGINISIEEYDSQRRANEGMVGGTGGYWTTVSSSATLSKGKGYLIASDIEELEFPATNIDKLFAYEAKSVTVKDYVHEDPNKIIHYTNGRGWNYIGGLTPCYFDVYLGGNDKYLTYKDDAGSSTITWNEAVYYYNGTTYSQTFLSGSNNINVSPFTPFFIQAGDNTAIQRADGKFIFGEGGLNVGITSATLLRSSKMSEKDVFSLKLTGSDISDETYIVLGDNYKDDYLISEDAVKLSSSKLGVWSVTDNSTSLFVNALARAGEKEIPLGVSVPERGAYSFDFSAIDRNNSIESAVLLDKENGTKTDLLTQSYSFETDETVKASDRFVLYINQTLTSIDQLNTNRVYAYANNGVLTVKNLKDKDNVQVLDISGRVIASGLAQSNEYSTLVANKGVYIVNVRGEKNTVIKVLNK